MREGQKKSVCPETPPVEKRRYNLRLSQPSAYRLVGDDQLDDRQGVEHSDGGDVPAKREAVIRAVRDSRVWTLYHDVYICLQINIHP